MSILDLPEEIILLIANREDEPLDIKSYKALSLTCKQLHDWLPVVNLKYYVNKYQMTKQSHTTNRYRLIPYYQIMSKFIQDIQIHHHSSYWRSQR